MLQFQMRKLALGILLLIISCLLLLSPVHASQTTEIIKEATWDIGGGESYEGSRARAKAKAERDAAEEAGVYIESYSKANNFQLTVDEVQLIAAGVLRVEVLDEEQRRTGKTSAAAWIKIKATVTAAAIDELRAKLKSKNSDEQLRHALSEADKLKKLLDEQNQQLAKLQQQLKQPQDDAVRQQTLAAVASNDRTTQALDALQEARRFEMYLAYPEAEKALDRALTLKPDFGEAYLTRGDLYLGKRDYAQAAAAYRQATQYAGGMKQAWFGLTMALAGQGAYTEAAQTFPYSVEYHPEALSAAPAKLEPYQKNGRWGFRRADGTLATPAKYNSADNFQEGLSRVTFADQVGYITATQDAALLLAVNKRFDPMNFSSGLAQVKLGNRYGFMDKSGHLVIEPRFTVAWSFDDGVACVEIEGKFGAIDPTGRWIIQPQTLGYIDFSEGLAAVCDSTGKYGFMDKYGQTVIPFIYEFAWEFRDGLAPVKLDGKWGYIDRAGQFIIPPRYAFAHPFENGKAKVYMSSGFGYINQAGKVVIPPIYESGMPFRNGVAKVMLKGYKYSAIDRNGNVAAVKETDRPKPKGLQPFDVNGKSGYKDEQNQVVIPAIFEDVDEFSDGLAPVKLQGKWGYIDTKGQIVIEPRYLRAYPFSEGLAVAEVEEYQNVYIDKQGQQAFTAQFQWARSFSEGLAAVALVTRKEGYKNSYKFGYIDHAGELVIPYQFSGGDDFSEGLAGVDINEEVWIDKRGQVIKQDQ